MRAREETAGATHGERIRQRRESLGMTQVQLAQRAGISQGTIARIERGKTASVRGSKRRALADALGVVESTLGDGAGDGDAVDVGGEGEAFRSFERALFRAMDAEEFLPVDFDAVREAFREVHPLLVAEADYVAMAREWLMAARQLRRVGHGANTAAIATSVAVGRGRQGSANRGL